MAFLRNILFLLFTVITLAAQAQEFVIPLQENAVIYARSKTSSGTAQKPTALTLPFFEDFTDYDPYPNPERWSDRYVYVNNTMGRDPVSRGVATFDALNEKGAVYYDTTSNYSQIYADSLTSLTIDLSGRQPADSLYLSFFYQRKGFGFSPKQTDSLMLYLLKSNGVWEQVWSMQGDTGIAPFRQVMIPITDTSYFSEKFQMRWLNKATIGISNSHWNLDYIRLDQGRSQADTPLRDIAFTKDPASILNDFSAMPFRHFKTNPAAFLNTSLTSSLRNNGGSTPNIPVGYTAKVQGAGTILGSGNTNATLAPQTQQTISFPMYNAGSYNPPNPNGKVTYENTFYCNSNYPGESKINDTILYNQVFDNYFAYDDGTAEQSYFLNLQANAPGYTAVEYALYAPDTLRGVAIRFARTLPGSETKEFSIGVFQNIAVNGGTDVLIHQENFLYPSFVDTANKFTIYSFTNPIGMPSGVFFIALIQPAGGTSDSLQIALDANRTGGNHRYFKVLNNWEPSQLDGALMFRPVVGSTLPLGISEHAVPELKWAVHPNPATDHLTLSLPGLGKSKTTYTITDVQGKAILNGQARDNGDIDIRNLAPGIYFIRITSEAGYGKPVKILKL